MSNMQLGEDTITMSMTLNPVNEAAFQKAVQSLETLNRAAVFHPTGHRQKLYCLEGGGGSPPDHLFLAGGRCHSVWPCGRQS